MEDRILFVDDDAEMRDFVREALSLRGFDVEVRGSADDALLLVQEKPPDVIVTDINLGATSGLEFCRRVNESRPDIPVVVVTGFGSMEAAIGAIRSGAYDFITKPIDMELLCLTLARAIQVHALRDEVKRLRELKDSPRALHEIVGNSLPMQLLFDLLERVSDSEATVLVTGESGTGKELIARAIHKRSKRAKGPFVAINCAALPERLLESGLFGHVRGAFTDAKQSNLGLLVLANHGTLFLDEIGEMTPATQVKLLRALQERTVRPVGGNSEIPFDVRIVAATNRDLESDVANHRFREDLYYRINVVLMHLPPLRARGNDILLLAQSFIGRFARQSGRAVRGISSEAAAKLLAYEWPGNVRELQNCIERAVALTEFEQIAVGDLPEKIREYHVEGLAPEFARPSELLSLDELDRRYMLRVLRAMKGNRALTAQVLGLDLRTVNRRLEHLGEVPPLRVVSEAAS